MQSNLTLTKSSSLLSLTQAVAFNSRINRKRFVSTEISRNSFNLIIKHTTLSTRRCVTKYVNAPAEEFRSIMPVKDIENEEEITTNLLLELFDRALDRNNLKQCLDIVLQIYSSIIINPSLIKNETKDMSEKNPQIKSVRNSKNEINDYMRKEKLEKIMCSRHKTYLHRCCQYHKSDIALNYISLFPSDPKLYSYLIKQLFKFKDSECVLKALDSRLNAGISNDQYAYSAQISAYGKLGDVPNAFRSFENSLVNGCNGIYVYNAMMDAYCRNNDLKGANSIWESICENKYGPDAVSYSSIINAWGNVGDFKKVRMLFDEMRERNIKPVPHIFTVIYDSLSKFEDIDINWALSLSDTLIEFEIDINKHVLSSMINCFSRKTITQAQVDKIYIMFLNYVKKEKPCSVVLSSILTFCSRQKIPERALEVWAIIQKMGIKPDGYVFSAALKACCTVNRNSPMTKFASILSKELLNEWHFNTLNNRQNKSLRIALNSLIKTLGWMGEVDESFNVYKEMIIVGPEPDEITYNTIMSVFADMGQVRKAMNILDDMNLVKIKPNVTSYGTLLNACAKAQEVGRAQFLMKQMKKNNIIPSVECYTSLIDACVKEGSKESIIYAYQYFEEMKKEGKHPNFITYGCLLYACDKCDDVEKALMLYEEACNNGVVLSDECHNILVDICTRMERLDDVLKLIKFLTKTHRDISNHTMNSVIRALSKDYVGRALILLRIFKQRHMRAERETYNSLIVSCVHESEIITALNLYNEMIKEDMYINKTTGSILIEGLCNAGDLESALMIADKMFASAYVKCFLPENLSEEDVKEMQIGNSITKDYHLHLLPNVEALGSVVCCLAKRKRLFECMYVFYLIFALEGESGLILLVKTKKEIFECLIELNCRIGRIDWALSVFDEWKDAAMVVMAQNKLKKGEEFAYKMHPKLSKISLAYLESCCRKYRDLEWRVLDVCAIMRQQAEWAHEAKLPRPETPNHHFSERE